MLRLQLPHVVAAFVDKHANGQRASDDVFDALADIKIIRENLQKYGGMNVAHVENFFSDSDSKETKKLTSFVHSIQNALKNRFRGLWILTNSSDDLAVYLYGLAYVWAMTLKKSAFVGNSPDVFHDLERDLNSFNGGELQGMREAVSFLGLNNFTPATSLSSKHNAVVAPLLSNRFVKFNDNFTVLVSSLSGGMAQLSSPHYLEKETPTVLGYIGSIFGVPVMNSVKSKFGVVVAPFPLEQSPEIGVIL